MPVTDPLESQYQNVNVLKKKISAYHFTRTFSFVYSADNSSTMQLTLHDSALTKVLQNEGEWAPLKMEFNSACAQDLGYSLVENEDQIFF